ncbi:hypothetical protein JCM33374_g619 [Metschnikowia sp. JCM 33374]|nr:hypothetical protein JCM33374_g619 [Metschnikowia sp. JCM 33374]
MTFTNHFRLRSRNPMQPAEVSESSTTGTRKTKQKKFRWGRNATSSSDPTAKRPETFLQQKTNSSEDPGANSNTPTFSRWRKYSGLSAIVPQDGHGKVLGSKRVSSWCTKRKQTPSRPELSSPTSRRPRWIQKSSKVISTFFGKGADNRGLDSDHSTSTIRNKVNFSQGSVNTTEVAPFTSTATDSSDEAMQDIHRLMEVLQGLATFYTSGEPEDFFNPTLSSEEEKSTFHEQESSCSKTTSYLQLSPTTDIVVDAGYSFNGGTSPQQSTTNISPAPASSNADCSFNGGTSSQQNTSNIPAIFNAECSFNGGTKAQPNNTNTSPAPISFAGSNLPQTYSTECSASENKCSQNNLEPPTNTTKHPTNDLSQTRHFSFGSFKALKFVARVLVRVKRAYFHFGKNEKNPEIPSEVGNSPSFMVLSKKRRPSARRVPSPEKLREFHHRKRRQILEGYLSASTKTQTIKSNAKVFIRQVKEEIESLWETLRSSSFFTCDWLLGDNYEPTLWNVLGLNLQGQCWYFRSEFSRNERFSLLASAKAKLDAPSTLEKLVLTFIEEDDKTISKRFKETLVSTELLLRRISPPIKRRTSTISWKNIKQPLTLDRREARERKIDSLVLNCKKKVEEVKLDPESRIKGTLVLFRLTFNVSRKHFAITAQKQIIKYIYQMANLRQETYSVFKTLCDLSHKYAQVLDFLSYTISSENALLRAQNMFNTLMTQLKHARISLDGVQRAIRQMKDGVEEYIIPMVSLAHKAISLEEECTEIYKEFCQNSRGISVDQLILNGYTGIDELSKDVNFLVARKEQIQAHFFVDALDELDHTRNVFREVQGNLETNIRKIMTRIIELQSPTEDAKSKNSTKTGSSRPLSMASCD